MVFGTYRKGSRYERELIDIFQQKGYSVIRSAGSGVGTPSPDILLFMRGKQYGFECKAWDKGSLGIEKSKFAELRHWSENTGMTTMIAWHLSREGWYFLHLDELGEKEKNFTVTAKRAREINRRVENLI
ncbi:Holliday junction resolvase Hjc [Candidatus Burarchaeum australiense]|nr:Holliday junction resolvase Hjc [Candidatus Burarchaeum australiense]